MKGLLRFGRVNSLFAASALALQVQREKEERDMALAGLLGEHRRFVELDRDFCHQLAIGLPLSTTDVESEHVHRFKRDRRKTLDWAERQRGGVPYPEAVRKMAEESPLYKEGTEQP